MEKVASSRSFGGEQAVYQHKSDVCNCDMRFGVYMPPAAFEKGASLPILYWLSGLTCTEENFITKAGAQRAAAELGLVIVAPDTSPRGADVPDDPDGAYDFGLGAGFYVDATEAPFDRHYNMYSYVTKELPALVEAALPVDGNRRGIFGHSMGGHGALTIHLHAPDRYRTCSVFAPIVAPSSVPFGKKAFAGYLGKDESRWANHDATELVRQKPSGAEILIDQGLADDFLDEQLRLDLFEAAAAESGQKIVARRQEGYDHGYYFISTFMEDHLRWHAERIG
ncbi:MAG: S-formylglutathione hydrolase [Pseudomonadota bacterium]